MLKIIIFTLFSVTYAVDPFWETLAHADCNGGMSLFPSSVVRLLSSITD